MSRTRIVAGSTVVLRRGEDLSDRFEPCSARPCTGYMPSGIRGKVLEVDTEPTARPIQIHFPTTGVCAWFSRSNVKVVQGR
jgi:hypothetical protein